jgi:DNA-nicking Smr family endonuclease
MSSEREPKQRWLSEEEAELWAYVMRDANSLRRKRRMAAKKSAVNGQQAAPLTNGAQVSSSSPVANAGASAHPGKTPPAAASNGVKRAVPVAPTPSSKSPAPVPPAPPPLANFDWRHAKRLSKGHDDIEARLDLHGRRQHEAYAALRAFLYSCRSRGFRNVLVITGKGGRREDLAQDDDSGACYYGEGRGVLRRLAPEWLREPEFRQMVVSYTESHQRHGGDGALYIQLRRAK